MLSLENTRVAIIGLGYVGLPLAVEFSKKYPVIGFDISEKRINELSNGQDVTSEVSNNELAKIKGIEFTTNINKLKTANVYIVTVPTPIDINKQPDLNPLINASEMLGKIIKKNDVIIYESTVYPGATEEVCLPAIERVSKLKYNKDFFAGYSPERINPGDKNNRLVDIIKVTSGSNRKIAEYVDNLYGTIIKAGTHKAESIKIAEGSKVIENIQRDVNIALVNEFFQIFNNIGIDTHKVINAASTKWNFMRLQPGLVGGHCISVDPYYLLHKSDKNGYIPDLIRTGREINDNMSSYLVDDFIKKLIKNKINPIDQTIALLGFTFKPNCPDIRNTKSFDLYKTLKRNGFKVNVYDPIVSVVDVKNEYGLNCDTDISNINEKLAFLVVEHSEIIENIDFNKFEYCYDFKGVLNE